MPEIDFQNFDNFWEIGGKVLSHVLEGYSLFLGFYFVKAIGLKWDH